MTADTHGLWYRHKGSVAAFGLVSALVGQVATQGKPRLLMCGLFVVALMLWVIVGKKVLAGGLSAGLTGFLAAVALIGCVAFPPATSKDVNSYAIYGRMVATYHVSPYTHVPRDFPGDHWYPKVSYYWSDSPSVYGPVFSGLSAGVMKVTGTSSTATRMSFQLIAALALIVSVLIAVTRIEPALAIVLIGLNPLLLTFGVNDAHCDLVIGAAVLGSCVLLRDRRVVLAGAVLAVALLVKISIAPAAAGACLWLWSRHGWKKAVAFGSSVAVLSAAAIGVAGGAEVLKPLREAAARQTRFSVWSPAHQILTWWLGSAPPTQSSADHIVGLVASLVVVVTSLILMLRHRRDDVPYVGVCVGLVVYQVFGAYVLCWYAAWSLPALALVWRSRTAFVAMAFGAWLAIAYMSGYAALLAALGALGFGWWRYWTGRTFRPWFVEPGAPMVAKP